MVIHTNDQVLYITAVDICCSKHISWLPVHLRVVMHGWLFLFIYLLVLINTFLRAGIGNFN